MQGILELLLEVLQGPQTVCCLVISSGGTRLGRTTAGHLVRSVMALGFNGWGSRPLHFISLLASSKWFLRSSIYCSRC